MDNSAAFFFKFIFYGLAAPFILVYWIIKGIVFLIRLNHEDRAMANSVVARLDYEKSIQPEIKNEGVSERNTLYGGTPELELPAKRAAND